MNLADLSIRRPIFMTCIIIVTVVMGVISMMNLPVDQMPDVTVPTVNVTVQYPGAGPQEIETLITKPLEDELGTISGIKNITSKSIEGLSQVTAEFRYDVDTTWAEQQVRDKVTLAKANFPTDDTVGEPAIRRFDPSDEPIMKLALRADLNEQDLYDLADQKIKVLLEQVKDVGQVQISGGRKREIQVQLDREKLKRRQLSVTQVGNQLRAAGENIPGGKIDEGDLETLYRSLGEFRNLSEISSIIVNFQNNEVPTRISDLGKIEDTLEDETTRSYVNGEKAAASRGWWELGIEKRGEVSRIGVATHLTSNGGRPLCQLNAKFWNSARAIRSKLRSVS